MKNLIYIVCLGAILTTLGCKKGEDDPFLSLRSRKARVAGEWKVTQRSINTNQTQGGLSSTSTTTYDGTTETTQAESGGFNISYTTAVTYDITFEKDGTYKMVVVTTEDGETQTETAEGNWAFIGKSKDAGLKNKEAISLSQTKYTDSDGYTENYAGTFMNYDNWIITQLKNKEIVISIDESSGSTGSGFNDQYTSTGTMTLTKK